MLAPQKNRAGQRTYRKRDVEMALRIKELLYDDQYTIAGAKKKLALELRGASKLKMVTPDMSAPQTNAPPTPQLAPTPTSHAPQPSIEADSTSQTLAVEMQSAAPEFIAAEQPERAPVSNQQRTAIRRLSNQLHELLMLLDSNGEAAGSKSHKK